MNKEKRNKIIYWVFTLWLSLGMVSTAFVQLTNPQDKGAFTADLGYPAYVPALLGVWKILGVIAVLMPGFRLLKEWAYAGFFFAMSGAAISHLASGHPVTEALPSVFLLILIVISWFFRPANRKLSGV